MIPVECPHCEANFQLKAEMIGKLVRCPECKDVFEVPGPPAAAVPPPAESPAPIAEPPLSTPQPIRDAPLVAERLSEEPPTVVAPSVRPAPPAPKLPTTPAAPSAEPVQKAQPIRTAAPVLPVEAIPTGPREVHWSEAQSAAATAQPAILDAELVDVPSRRTKKGEPASEGGPEFVRRRKRSNPFYKLIFFGIVLLIGLGAVGGVVGLFFYLSQAEERQRQDAEESYKNGNYGAAKAKYEQLIADYPASSSLDRYKFFAALADTQDVINSIATKEKPEGSVQRYQDFLREFGESPFAQPETGFGADVLQAGTKLCDAIGEHAAEHLKKYRDELKRFKTLEEELTATDKTIELGRSQLPIISKYRDKEGPNLETQRKRFDELEQGVLAERKRLSVLAPFRNIVDDPTAEKIEAFELTLKENKLANDAEAIQIIIKAERRLRELIGPQGRAILAQRVPQDPFPPLLFAAAPAGGPPPRLLNETTPETVYAVARGILYALDANTGTLLWGVRLGPATIDQRIADVPLRVTVGEGAADWVLVPSELGGRPGLTARLARTGEPVWHQRLEAAPAGRPVIVGGRVYLPLRDKMGTVAEFDLVTGTRNGELNVRQPLGGGLTVVPGSRAGENFLVVPGDTRRVFLFEIGRTDEEGNPLPSRLIRVLLTEHPRDSLRGEPLVITSLDEAGPRFLILSQVEGGSGMKLRAFPLPPLSEWIAQADQDQQPTPQPLEVTAPGWAWFPPITDGERVILATDSGAFVAYGVAQIGNRDKPLFNVPGPKQPGDQDSVARSQIVYADEETYWAVLNGQLVRLRTVVDATAGLRIQPIGTSRTVGEPVHRAQVRTSLEVGVVVTRVGQNSGVMAQAFDLNTGLLRWQRRLGYTAAGQVVVGKDLAILADEDGGVYSVQLAARGATSASEAVMLAPPFAEVSSRAVIAGSPDGSTAWVLAPMLDRTGRRVRVRKIVNGVIKADTSFPLADELAGAAVVLGDSVALPVHNGYVYRTNGTGNQLEVGPLWRGDGVPAQATCYLQANGAEELLVTDGGSKFARWRWPAAAMAKPERLGGPWATRNPITLAPVSVKTSSGERVAAADAAGVVYLFDANKSGDPIRRWRSTANPALPSGPLVDRLAAVHDNTLSLIVGCIDGRHFFALNPDQVEPVWVALDVVTGELPLLGWTYSAQDVLATESTGRVSIINCRTGQVRLGPGLPNGFAASAPASWLLPQTALLPLADGSVIELQLQDVEKPR